MNTFITCKLSLDLSLFLKNRGAGNRQGPRERRYSRSLFTPLSFRKALRPSVYLVSLLPLLSVLTLTSGKHFVWVFFAGVGVLLLQHGTLVLNDVIDWRRGADVEKFHSWIHFHHGNTRATLVHGWISVAIGFLVGASAAMGAGQERLLLVSLPLVLLAVFFNSGEKPLSYGALSEWATGLCYGPGVAGSLFWLAEGHLDGRAFALMAAYAFFSVGVLLSHQPPQVMTDSLAGKRSFAVRYGARSAVTTAKFLFALSLGFLCLAYGLHLAVVAVSALALWRVTTGRATPKAFLAGATQVVGVAAAVAIYIKGVS